LEASAGVEGWVIISAMVDPDGKPFEVGVERSSGNKNMETLAVQSIERATFEPGTSDGRPVESVFEMKYVFQNGSFTPGAHPAFIRAYGALQEAVRTGDRAAADAAIQKLTITTLYEDAYLGLAQYIYATRWGDADAQLRGLLRALGGEEFLAHTQRRAVIVAALQHQLERHDYFEVLQLWQRLQKVGVDKDTAANIRPVIGQIETLRTGSASYVMSGTLDDNGAWYVHLLKSRFKAEVSSGAISKVKMKCSRKFVAFTFDPQIQYEVRIRYGDCVLSLEGTPGTRFELTQL
jgi:TonB family protein